MQLLRIHDKAEIRRRLRRDSIWTLYAQADLDEGMFEWCDWWLYGDALALVFRGLQIRPILVVGDAASTREILLALPESSGYLNLKPEQFEAAAGIFSYRQRYDLLRMTLRDFRPRHGAVELLTAANCAEIENLYASGNGSGVAFAPYQLDTGFFRGIRHHGDLVAVAGVHVVSRMESVAAVGNVLTRSDHRGKGLAQTVTSAVVAALTQSGIRTIGLNVEQTNAAAIHAYEAIGFRSCFPYFEGFADRSPLTPRDPATEL